MSFRPINSKDTTTSTALPAKPAAVAAIEPSKTTNNNGEQAVNSNLNTVQGPQIPAQLAASSFYSYNGVGVAPSVAAASYSPSTGYSYPGVGVGGVGVAGPSAGPSTGAYPGYNVAYPGYDAYASNNSGYDYAASGYAAAYGAGAAVAGPSSSYGMTNEELAAQQSIYTPDNVQQEKLKTKAPKGQARTTVLRKGAGEVWEDQTLMEWDPNHFRLFIGDLGNDVNDEDLIKAFGPEKGWKSFVKAKVIRDKVTQKTRGYGFVSYSDPEDFMAAWKAMNGRYVGSRPVKIQKASTTVRQVNIGEKKAHELDTKKESSSCWK